MIPSVSIRDDVHSADSAFVVGTLLRYTYYETTARITISGRPGSFVAPRGGGEGLVAGFERIAAAAAVGDFEDFGDGEAAYEADAFVVVAVGVDDAVMGVSPVQAVHTICDIEEQVVGAEAVELVDDLGKARQQGVGRRGEEVPLGVFDVDFENGAVRVEAGVGDELGDAIPPGAADGGAGEGEAIGGDGRTVDGVVDLADVEPTHGHDEVPAHPRRRCR